MNEMKLGLTPTVLLCFIGGAILGAILSLWIGAGPAGVFVASLVMGVIGALGGTFI